MREPERERHTTRPPPLDPGGIALSLLGTFELRVGAQPLDLTEAPKRLIALLGVRDRAIPRTAIAETLWPDTSQANSQGNLRSLLGRLDDPIRQVLRINNAELSLADTVTVDLHEIRALAQRLLTLHAEPSDADLDADSIARLGLELLPDWHDEWALTESAHWHELRVRALEEIADRLTLRGEFGSAAEAALLAIAAEPLRETSHAALIRTHLAEGNQSAALAAFGRYRAALLVDMNVEPTITIDALVYNHGLTFRGTSSAIRQVRTAVAGEDTPPLEVVASGISMEPSIRHGDKLIVSDAVALAAGRIVVAIHHGAWIVKRLAMRNGMMVLRSDNADEEVALADVEVQGVVVELRRTV